MSARGLRLKRAKLTPVLAVISFLAGCGGSGNAASIARNLDDAIEATTAAGRASDDQAESAAKNTICQGLSAFGSEPTAIATETLQAYADQQQVAANLSLHSVDSDAAQRLANAAQAISDTQEAADVASELGC